MAEIFYFSLQGVPQAERDAGVAKEELVSAALQAPGRRNEFLTCRYVLRTLLGDRLGLKPSDVPITIDSLGKPQPAEGWARLQFSITHSGQWGVVALSDSGPVGVDLEEIKPLTLSQDLLELVLHPEEVTRIGREPEARQRLNLFYRCWTVKESYTKALGKGLFVDFSSLKADELGSSTFDAIERYLLSVTIIGGSQQNETHKLCQLLS